MSKIFVLRLNSLLSSADSTLRFGEDNQIVIPMPVIDELQNYRGKPEKVKIARQILKYLESFNINKLLAFGEEQSNKSILRIVKTPKEPERIDLDGITHDDLCIFQICKQLQKESKNQVVLVSKRASIRIKAKSIGIVAEDFKDDLFPMPEEQYKGRCNVQTKSTWIDYFYREKYLPICNIINYKKIKWYCNMYVQIKDVDENSSKSAIGRYDGEKIVPLLKHTYPYGVEPLNVGQKMMFDCLAHSVKDATIAIIKGAAGTGKTYCALAYALQAVNDKEFVELLITSPSVTVGNEKLGYLPGNMVEKISPYLGGIKDNLNQLISGNKHGEDRNIEKGYVHESGGYYFGTRNIQVQPIGFVRGRTITKTIFIIDETQNIDPGDIKSIVTRSGEGSKFIFLGDPSQVDNPNLNENYNGLVYLSEKMKGIPGSFQVTFEEEENVRSELSKIASKIL